MRRWRLRFLRFWCEITADCSEIREQAVYEVVVAIGEGCEKCLAFIPYLE
jgi:hypothetical protein